MQPDVIYKISQYVRNGKRIDALVAPDGTTTYYLMMVINTPQGRLPQQPLVLGATIEEAYDNAAGVEEAVIAAVRDQLGKPGILVPSGQAPGPRILT